MQTNHSVVPFCALVVGIILILSRILPLAIIGFLLILGGLYAPFYDDLFRKLIHRVKRTKPETLEPEEPQTAIGQAQETTNEQMESQGASETKNSTVTQPEAQTVEDFEHDLDQALTEMKRRLFAQRGNVQRAEDQSRRASSKQESIEQEKHEATGVAAIAQQKRALIVFDNIEMLEDAETIKRYIEALNQVKEGNYIVYFSGHGTPAEQNVEQEPKDEPDYQHPVQPGQSAPNPPWLNKGP